MANVLVTVNEGKIRGIKKKSEYSGIDYYCFFGVPYGQSTGGAARFKDPVKIDPWKSILDATTEKEGCLQFSFSVNRITGSEDCLFNNIYTPELPNDGCDLKPVIVCIHPGGLFHGTPQTKYYGSPEYVIHRDIVYVCISFRLHILGFLNLNLEGCMGNQAYKDILLSLRWINENIHVFNGDPNNVTLLGSSSGSGLVHHLMLFPEAKGLFHKAVAMGVYIYNPTIYYPVDHVIVATNIANLLGYKIPKTNENKRLLSIFKKVSIKDIIRLRYEATISQQFAFLFPCSAFGPICGEEIKNNIPMRIPLMFGICDREAVIGFTKGSLKGTMDNFYTSYRQNCFGWGYNITEKETDEIKDKINSFYLKNSCLEYAPLSCKVDIQSDIATSSAYESFIDLISADLPSSVFVYKFQFEAEDILSLKDTIKPLLDEPIKGTYHAEDFSYWNCMTTPDGQNSLHPKPETREIIDTFTKLICTFARTGNPNYEGLNVEWKPTTPEKPCYLNINETLSVIDGKLNGERMEFWEEIMKKYKK